MVLILGISSVCHLINRLIATFSPVLYYIFYFDAYVCWINVNGNIILVAMVYNDFCVDGITCIFFNDYNERLLSIKNKYIYYFIERHKFIINEFDLFSSCVFFLICWNFADKIALKTQLWRLNQRQSLLYKWDTLDEATLQNYHTLLDV